MQPSPLLASISRARDMLPPPMVVTDVLSPLAAAALSLIKGGATADDLVHRFEAEGARVDPASVTTLLAQLTGLGLVRVAHGTGVDSVHVSTSLGRRVSQRALSLSDDADLLRDLERMRTDLLSTMAHELRTPLTAIRTSVGLLRDPTVQPSTEQRERLLESIERNAERMQRFVSESLDLTRFRAGQIQLQLRRFDAVELARSVSEAFPAARQRIRGALPQEPVLVFGDRRRLEHALINLVSNALKYSPSDAPVDVSVEAREGEVRWSVTDRGTGIPEHDRPRLFERFFVGARQHPAAHDGVGLGLPISLAIVQAHDGRIDVVSEVGRGSRFTISVPTEGPRGHDEP